MDTETAASPADDGPVTLVDAVEASENQGGQTEAQTQAGETAGTFDDLAKEALGDTDATPEEEIEVEYEGDKRKLPPKWRDAFLRQQDYTRKTMDLGDQRKTFDQEQTTFRQTASQIATNFQAHVQLGALQAQIKELEALDVSYWSQEDIDAASANLNAKRAQAATLSQNLTNYQAQQAQLESDNSAKLRQACLAEVAAKVPNFTDARRQELESLAVKVGADPKEVANLRDSWAYELLHFADIGQKFIERQRRAAQMRTAQAGSPATMLGGGSTGSKDPESMSMAEYAAWREAGNG